jgi:hypothetical protein
VTTLRYALSVLASVLTGPALVVILLEPDASRCVHALPILALRLGIGAGAAWLLIAWLRTAEVRITWRERSGAPSAPDTPRVPTDGS